ncbi:MAG: alpha/beta hydrolase [Waddliaceae bacterium]|jgi:pimeloyl-ACP methyl ester carboxylesterase|nr:alpha/beta hydrolase [Waddliaceae bacterium]MBT3579226.1 alpha/beta hydrolase [Waddliaceae bacterium]MBT4444274.1 alpha/beta hydrolase [Waddliaceae bacterium]MBT6928925.1 alpha/beta hydrolase [Waddliaceae bacterium]MBT7264172.1 alpha/beta hydrolase [Waddliaceae bacterium]
MENPRKYGKAPYNVVVVHGGPGAPGQMSPVAKELSSDYGVLEPLQTKNSINGQVEELKSSLDENAKKPVTLIGWSWGAMLSFIFTARHPEYVKKLILVGSSPFEAKYAANIMKTRMSRLDKENQEKLSSLLSSMNNPEDDSKELTSSAILRLISITDSYQPIPHDNTCLEFQPDIYKKVNKEASLLRSSGELLRYSEKVRCPVVAIHGDYDPHPYEGVKTPLSRTLQNFKFILLNDCGHTPWHEKLSKDDFYALLKNEI